jgi:hypothetical protein
MDGILIRRFVIVAAFSLSFGCIGEATPRPAASHPTSFKECVGAGGKILKSFPAQCVTAEGMRFIDDERARNEKSGHACKDLCGNGRCEEIVCMAVGCPCGETTASCPQDCKEQP